MIKKTNIMRNEDHEREWPLLVELITILWVLSVLAIPVIAGGNLLSIAYGWQEGVSTSGAWILFVGSIIHIMIFSCDRSRR